MTGRRSLPTRPSSRRSDRGSPRWSAARRPRSGPPPPCVQRAAYSAAGRTPDHFATGCGARQRFAPTGGAAIGNAFEDADFGARARRAGERAAVDRDLGRNGGQGVRRGRQTGGRQQQTSHRNSPAQRPVTASAWLPRQAARRIGRCAILAAVLCECAAVVKAARALGPGVVRQSRGRSPCTDLTLVQWSFAVLSFVVGAGSRLRAIFGAIGYGGAGRVSNAADVVGRPDLAGIYSNDDETGTPMERPDEFEGLTLADHHAREDRRDRRGARSSLQSAGRQRGVAQQHLAAAASDLRHVRPQQQTPVADHGPRGRQDPGAHGGSRSAAADRRRQHEPELARAVQQLSRHGPLRSLHHARHSELDDAGRLRQPLRDRAGARQRRDPLRDDSRGARDSARSPAAHLRRLEAILGRRARLVGRRHARRRDDELPAPRPRRNARARTSR